MYSNYENDDDKIYRKASLHVKGRLFVSFVILMLLLALEYFLFHQNWYYLAPTQIDQYLLPVNIGQLVLFFILILLLSTGKTWTRIVYWLLILADFGLLYFPVIHFLNDSVNTLSYICLIGCILLKDLELIRLGIYIFRGHWPKVFYDYILEIDDEEEKPAKKQKIEEEPEEEIFAPIKAADYRKPIVIEQPEEEPEEELPPVSKSKVSLRLGICAYGSLILFPILVQLFSKFFVSMDMQSVFAVGDIFILTMCSAVIWTLPVFFLFYEHRYANRVIVICIIAEICVILAYAPKFLTYISSGRYAWTVFLLFIGLNIVRYGLLGYAIAPIFTEDE